MRSKEYLGNAIAVLAAAANIACSSAPDEPLAGIPSGDCGEPTPLSSYPVTPEWSYDGAQGPEAWGHIDGYETCDTGDAQSPIDIVTAAAQPTTKGLRFIHYDAALPLVLANNGHALQVNYASSQDPDVDPHIEWGQKPYYLAQLHWHSMSEHTLDGNADFPFEVHLVHRAADESLAVVGVLYGPGDDDAMLGSAIQRAPLAGEQHTCGGAIDLAALAAEEEGFFAYDGSLTTPGCAQGVEWFVLGKHLRASEEQLETYQALFHETPTNRPVQPLNGRMLERYLP